MQQTTHIRWPCHSNTGSLLLLHLAVEVVVSVFIAKVASVSSTLTGTLTCTTGLTREPEHTEQQSVTTCKRAAVSDSFFTEVPFFFPSDFFLSNERMKSMGKHLICLSKNTHHMKCENTQQRQHCTMGLSTEELFIHTHKIKP